MVNILVHSWKKKKFLKKIKKLQQMDIFHGKYFRQLLEEEEHFRKNRKSFFYEHPDHYYQLEFYRSMIADQCFWQSRQEYVSLIEDFLKRRIDHEKFKEYLDFIISKNRKLLYTLQTLASLERIVFDPIQQQKDFEKLFANSIDYESKGFANLISQIVNFENDWLINTPWKDRIARRMANNNDDFAEKYRNFVASILVTFKKYVTK